MPPFRQNLTGATGTTLTGAHGGVQQLGAAAQRRLAGQPPPATPPVVPTGRHPLNPDAAPPPFSGPAVMGAAGMVAPPGGGDMMARFNPAQAAAAQQVLHQFQANPGTFNGSGSAPPPPDGPGLSSYLNGGAAPAIAQAVHSRMMSESGDPGPDAVGGGGGGMANFAPGGGEGDMTTPGAPPTPKTPPIMDPAQNPMGGEMAANDPSRWKGGRDPATGGLAARGVGNISTQVARTKPGVNSDAFAAAKPKPKTPRTGQGGRINQLLKRARGG